eukprot:8291962-Pyramimonas_sp.AAC.1
MQQEGFALSPKSVAVCSQLEDARRVANIVKQHGFTVQASSFGTCLGVDLAAGRRPVRSTILKRFGKTRQASKRLRGMAKASRQYLKC